MHYFDVKSGLARKNAKIMRLLADWKRVLERIEIWDLKFIAWLESEH